MASCLSDRRFEVHHAFELSSVASSVIHMHILKGALTSHSTTSTAHWAQHPMQQQQGHLRQAWMVLMTTANGHVVL